ncbi:hypothetical protein HOB94_02900 [bacterium]|nr:hypothetical protein [bacterium]
MISIFLKLIRLCKSSFALLFKVSKKALSKLLFKFSQALSLKLLRNSASSIKLNVFRFIGCCSSTTITSQVSVLRFNL